MRVLERTEFPRLLDELQRLGYRLLGPTIRDGAIVVDELEGAQDLPIGWTDEQGPGRYRLRRRKDEAYFGYVVGPQSMKRVLFPPQETLVRIRRRPDGPTASRPQETGPPVALVGVRGCDLAAMDVQDRVFVRGPYVDPRYQARRDRTFIMAVDCLEPGGLCFCATMKTGPEARGDFDLRLTELGDIFLAEVGSDAGRDLLDAVRTRPSSARERSRRLRGLNRSAESMAAGPDPEGLPELLLGNLDHARWDDVADRCLACGNCTQVCPTCFCHDVNDRTVLGRDEVQRERTWDSCFVLDHSRIHGGAFRPTIKDRYRQWLTHKLGSWEPQFGTSGCVGCGRCIAWCPVGIDIREEVAAIRADPEPPQPLPAPAQYTQHLGDALTPIPARVASVRHEHGEVYTLAVEPPGPFHHRPGQFNMVSIAGVGEIPVSIAGRDGARLLHTIRGVGPVSRALTSVHPGDTLEIRGAFGSHWPLEEARGRDVTVIAGGIGLAPLRAPLLHMATRPHEYPRVRLLYGARTPADVLYDFELLEWNTRPPAGPVTSGSSLA